MNIDFMRKIDRRVGIPLCFFLSPFARLKYALYRHDSSPRPKKILFIEMSEMGSMVLAYSMFKKTAELFPDAEFFFLTFEKNRYAIDILGVIPQKNVITIDDKNLPGFLQTTISALRTIRKGKITTVIDMEFFSRFTALLASLCGARELVGFFRYHGEGLYRGSFLTHKVIHNPQIHTAYNLLNLIYALASTTEDVPLPKRKLKSGDLILPKRSEITESARDELLKKLSEQNSLIKKAETLILFNPNASDIIPLRKWPLDSYIQLGRRLLEHYGVFIIITGIEAERPAGDHICLSLNSNRCLNFAGRTTFSELIELYQISHALITNDSGPAHFSAMTGIQTFVFFGPETPKLYAPLGENSHIFYSDFSCSPCVSVSNHRKSPCRDNRCLKVIEAKDVYITIKNKLWG
jgi:ADP-heptose:LPS heptosyltransferase